MKNISKTIVVAGRETGSFLKDAGAATGKTFVGATTAHVLEEDSKKKRMVAASGLLVAGIFAPVPAAIGLATIGAYSVGKGVTKAILDRRAGTKHDPHAQVAHQPADQAAEAA